MERLVKTYTPLGNKDKIITSCETPRINGTKPAEILKIQEECKKHIRRDGRK